jgi:FkbM family methyltransferase
MSSVHAALTRVVDSARYRARAARGVSARGFYAHRLRPGDLAFDIGANLGQHTEAMLKSGAHVVALEPQTDLARALARKFPAATVLPVGASDQPGEAILLTSKDHPEIATLEPAFAALHPTAEWDGEAMIRLTTLDELISEFGLPAFVKVDAEGFDDKVLTGLSQPVEQISFEIQPGLLDVARQSFRRLAALGCYECRVMWQESWQPSAPMTAAAILTDMPSYGNVYARLIR